MEIERKYLVDHKKVPALVEGYSGKELVQGYLAIDENGKEVRVRKSGATCTLTVKSGKGMVREETEIEISEDQFEALIGATGDLKLQKTRYKIPLDGVTAEVDVYRGKLEGLAVVEVEFESEEAASVFVKPEWFGEEKTNDSSLKNAALALQNNKG